MTEPAVTPFRIAVPQAELDDLHDRIARTRWPEREPVAGWEQGVPLATMRALCDYWRDGYDWRRCEAMLNGWDQYRTELDGLAIHFLHVRSPEPDAMPLIMTHGWPGSIVEFAEVIGPLTDPARHGGDPRDAFHLVMPSLPGYGFSDKPGATGWGFERIAAAWGLLMTRLGYRRYAAQGGDWGAAVTRALAIQRPEGLMAVHLNQPLIAPSAADIGDDPTPAERAMLAQMQHYFDIESGYAKVQSTRPQTIGYALADSPVGQAAWVYEKLQTWTDNPGSVEDLLSRDTILDNIMFYWLTNAGASSARLYWESLATAFAAVSVDFPVGISLFAKEAFRSSRRWADRYFPNIIHWNEVDRGAHFAALEQPKLFVTEVRDCFRQLR